MRGCWDGWHLVKSRTNTLLRAGRNLCDPLGLRWAELCIQLNEPLRGESFFSFWIVLCVRKRENGEIIVFKY